MNGYIAIGLILIVIGLYFMSKKKDDTPDKIIPVDIKEEDDFCLKIKPYSDDMFCILFSNDGFKTFEEYEETLGNYQFCQVALFYTKESAIEKSKTLLSYQQCLDHNKIVKDRDKVYRDNKDKENRIRWDKQRNRESEEVIIKCNKPTTK